MATASRPRSARFAFMFAQALVFLPLTLPYLIEFFVRVFLYKDSARRGNASVTAAFVLMTRHLLHKLGMRTDPAAVAMWEAHPLAPILPIRMGFILGQKISPFIESALLSLFGLAGAANQRAGTSSSFAPKRFAFFDRTIEQAQNEQLVIMGAGFESRPYNASFNPNLIGNAKQIFEVDRIETQRVKLDLLQQTKLNKSGIKFVAVNFNTEKWQEKLTAAGFDANKPFYMIWEGVTGYLPESVVIQFLHDVAILLKKNPKSRLGFSYVGQDAFTNDRTSFLMEKLCRLVGEPHISGFPKKVDEYMKEVCPELEILEWEDKGVTGFVLVKAV
jgi:methyltransferase (TIGR00027 family)